MKKDKDNKIEELERRISELEKNRIIYVPLAQSAPQIFHYHNGTPCYNNPCFWSGIGTNCTPV